MKVAVEIDVTFDQFKEALKRADMPMTPENVRKLNERLQRIARTAALQALADWQGQAR